MFIISSIAIQVKSCFQFFYRNDIAKFYEWHTNFMNWLEISSEVYLQKKIEPTSSSRNAYMTMQDDRT